MAVQAMHGRTQIESFVPVSIAAGRTAASSAALPEQRHHPFSPEGGVERDPGGPGSTAGDPRLPDL
jgi:hypothetical protein